MTRMQVSLYRKRYQRFTSGGIRKGGAKANIEWATEWRWRLRGKNGRIICSASEGFARRAGANKNLFMTTGIKVGPRRQDLATVVHVVRKSDGTIQVLE